MKKIILSAGVLLSSLFAMALVDPGGGGEHYCKNNSTMNTGLCVISNTTCNADCVSMTGNSTVKDCYDAVNN